MTPQQLLDAAKCYACLGPKELQQVIAYAVANATASGGCCIADTASAPTIRTDATALAANASRKGWRITNMGTSPLYVKRGAGATNASGGFEVILQPGLAQDDGKGEWFDDNLYSGIVTVAGTSPRYIAVELT